MELKKVVRKAKGPVLFIENKSLYPQHLKHPDAEGRIGDFWTRETVQGDEGYPTVSLNLTETDKPDVTLIAYGGMALLAAEAARNVFMRDEISVETLIPSMIKPLPMTDFLPSICQSGRVVIAEESVCVSGWGAELTASIQEEALYSLKRPVVRIGAKSVPIPSSKPLEDRVLPQVSDIEAAIYKQMGS